MRPVLALVALGLLLATPLGAAQDAPRHPLGGPRGVHVAYGDDPSSSVVVSWNGPPDDDASIIYGRFAKTNEVQASSEPIPGSDRVSYSVTLDGLEAGASYVYAVTADDLESDTYRFRTAPAADGGDAPAFTFAAWADHGVRDPQSPVPGPDSSDPARNAELARDVDPDFHLAAGDIAYADGYTPTWDRYLNAYEPYLAETPYMTVPGDHEREPGQGYAQYDTRFEMPDGERDRWYAFRYGNAMIVGLNTGEICREEDAQEASTDEEWRCGQGTDNETEDARTRYPNPRQMNFLETQLQRAEHDPGIDWTVVVHHHPAYSSGPKGPHPDVQRYWVPLYDEHGVDLVVSGHDRVYQRSEPLRYGEAAGAGTTYVVNGAGGAGDDDLEESAPSWEAARADESVGAAVFTVDGDRLEGRFLALDGSVRDSFVLEDARDGARLVDPAAEEADDGSDEADSVEDTPDRNDRSEGTDDGADEANRSTGPGGNPSSLDEAEEAGAADAIPTPGLAAALAALLLATRRRR